MASRGYSIIRDQNSSVHYHGASVGGKTNGSKALKKGGISGRKPLGDLSNSVKPAPTQASKKLISNIVPFTEIEPFVSKISSGASKKKSISNATEKQIQVGGRKALSDISNSGKPRETSKKSGKATTKLGTVSEKPIHYHNISEECFLHNHQECIKARKKTPEVDEFLKIIGLDNGFSLHSASPWPSPPVVNKMKPETLLKTFGVEEMAEQFLTEEDPSSSRELELSPPCRTPKSLAQELSWNDNDSINFKLTETPASLKF